MKNSILFIIVLLPLFWQFRNNDTSNKKKPNVIIFLVDDLGWTDLACFGSDYYQTPAIDQLSAEGISFTNSYSACTVCSPSRATVLTGKYPARLHLTDWIEGHKYPWAKMNVPDWTMYLSTSEYTLAEAFKDAGYQTAHFGKWHLGEKEQFWPENHGFDTNIAGWSKGAPNKSKKAGYSGYFTPYGNPRLKDGPEGEYLTERLTEEVCKYIDENSEAPFFINFWFYNVHMPLQAKQDKIGKYSSLVDSSKNHKNPVYAAMIEHTDEAIGKVIRKLKEKGLYENTIILFSSDNGGLIGRENNRITSNKPLRYGKGGIYEGGVRVPTILYYPFNKSKGFKINEPVIATDYFPTLLEMARIELTDELNKNIDGISWLPLINGEDKLGRDAIYWHYPHYHQEGAVPYSAIRKGNWKLIENLETGQIKLYNLLDDIGESEDKAEEFPETVMELKAMLIEWRRSVNAQMPVPNPDYDKNMERKKKDKKSNY